MARRYPHQLSGGQQQRVGVARALAADPPVLLMDEPFSAVDPIVRASLQDELLRLQAELHKTVVFVTHDIEEAIKVGDQVAIFRPGGHLVQVDTPAAAAGRARRRLRRGLPRLRPRHPPAVLPRRRTRWTSTPARSSGRTPRPPPPWPRPAGPARPGCWSSIPSGFRAAGSRPAELESAPGSSTLADLPLTSATVTRSGWTPTRCAPRWTPPCCPPPARPSGWTPTAGWSGVTSYDRLRDGDPAGRRGGHAPSQRRAAESAAAP